MKAVSLFASAIRPKFFETFLDSLKFSTVWLEVIFAGNCTEEEVEPFVKKYNFFKYIHTANIKPCQAYEVARRACRGELIHWTADDCVYSPDFIGKAYYHWKEQNNEKLILSLQTKENGMFCDMKLHSFYGFQFQTPRMAPLGLMSRTYLEELGGYDRRYICGQGENDICMRAYADGGKVEIFGDKQNLITIDHYARHGIKRPFAEGFQKDRQILETSWADGQGHCLTQRTDKFEPFEDKDILTKSQSNNLSRWV